MLGESAQVLTSQLFADWLNPSAGRSRSYSSALLEEYETRRQQGLKSPGLGNQILGHLGKAVDRKV